jgi:hypothetical protein
LLCKVVKKLAALLASRLSAVHKIRKVRREDMTVAEPVKEVPCQLAAINSPVVLETVSSMTRTHIYPWTVEPVEEQSVGKPVV